MIKNFKSECENNQQIMSTLDSVLDRLKTILIKEKVNNEVLQKIVNIDHSNITCLGKCDMLLNIAETLTNEVSMRVKLEKVLSDQNSALSAMQDVLKQKEQQMLELQTEITQLQQTLHEAKLELSKQTESYQTLMNSKLKEMQSLQQENQALHNDLNDVKLQLEIKVHSLKEKLVDNENVTDKLKNSYECQIDNLNLMITKLTSYLKDKTAELEGLRKVKEQLSANIEESHEVIKSLEDEVKAEKQKQEKLITDFESERILLKNIVTDTESVMEDQKVELNNIIGEHKKTTEILHAEVKSLKELVENDKIILEELINEKDVAITSLLKELSDVKEEKDNIIKDFEIQQQELKQKVIGFTEELCAIDSKIQHLTSEKHNIEVMLEECKEVIKSLEDEVKAEKQKQEKLITDFESERILLKNIVTDTESVMEDQKVELNNIIGEHKKTIEILQAEVESLKELVEKDKIILEKLINEKDVAITSLLKELSDVKEEKDNLIKDFEIEKQKLKQKVIGFTEELCAMDSKIQHLTSEKHNIEVMLEECKEVIKSLEDEVKAEKQKQEKLITDFESERILLKNIVTDTESVMEDQKVDINNIIGEHKKTIEILQAEVESLKELVEKDKIILEKLINEKDVAITSLLKELSDVKEEKDNLIKDFEIEKQKLKQKVIGFTEELCAMDSKIQHLTSEKHNIEVMLEERKEVIKSLEDEVKAEKQKQEKLITDFESECILLKNIVTVTESVMEDQKVGLNNIIGEHKKTIETLQAEVKSLKELIEKDKIFLEELINEKDVAITSLLKELSDVKEEKDNIINDFEIEKQELKQKVIGFTEELRAIDSKIQHLTSEKHNIEVMLEECKEEKEILLKCNNELIIKHNSEVVELKNEIAKLINALNEQDNIKTNLELTLKEEAQHKAELIDKLGTIEKEVNLLKEVNQSLEIKKSELLIKLVEAKEKIDTIKNNNEEIDSLKVDNMNLHKIIEENKTVITNLEQLIKHELELNQKLRDETSNEKVSIINKFTLLQEYREKAEQELDKCQKEVHVRRKQVDDLQVKLTICEQDLIAKDGCISKMSKEKDAVISAISKELLDEKTTREKCQKESEIKTVLLYELKQNLQDLNREREVLNALRNENEDLIKAAQEKETLLCQERPYSQKYTSQVEKDHRIQVDKDSSSNITQSSLESLKTITDLEKIINDKNRTITMLQSDITFLKSIMAESETKLLDVTKELEVSKENCQQLSNQLKKIVYQKNEEIAELKKQVNKMSATETRASQIIKVSAKYQAIILKRIAEIKSNTVLKELTNYGNSNSCDNELRRSLNAGTITMEDLENFLETTDKHLKRCSEKQLVLQKERDRLYEVNRIHESEIINLRKFLTELSVSLQTFNSVKDLYMQKLIRVVSFQRTARREILNLDGQVTDACMCKLERGYAAVMQDLSECAMNLERWVERCVSRTVSVEKIKQAFSDNERVALAGGSFQNAALEVQLEELEKSFQRLLEEVARAQRGEGARDAQSVTVMEVKAEYEDKLNRMKAKMKQLFNEQMSVIKEKQRDEIAILEQEVVKARDTLARTSRNYEEHIRKLTTELWTVGEKFLMSKDEAEWLKRKQKSGSLMSLQHVHSSGLVPPPEELSRPSDSASLRSLPTNNDNKANKEGRGLHMSDEEGEVFDNRWLKELTVTPRKDDRDTLPRGQRLSELKWRNSLCPPHLKSSYPAETQFAPAVDEEDIKCLSTQGRQQRKEVGITAYKKPGPPTPSKQAGRLSATDSELRESLRVEGDPHASRKTGTPSRLRSLFRSSKIDTNEGTPRSRRLSNIFRKK